MVHFDRAPATLGYVDRYLPAAGAFKAISDPAPGDVVGAVRLFGDTCMRVIREDAASAAAGRTPFSGRHMQYSAETNAQVRGQSVRWHGALSALGSPCAGDEEIVARHLRECARASAHIGRRPMEGHRPMALPALRSLAEAIGDDDLLAALERPRLNRSGEPSDPAAEHLFHAGQWALAFSSRMCDLDWPAELTPVVAERLERGALLLSTATPRTTTAELLSPIHSAIRAVRQVRGLGAPR
jgi:hypothetical protein